MGAKVSWQTIALWPGHLDDGGMNVMRIGKAVGERPAAAMDLAAIGLGARQRPGHRFEGRPSISGPTSTPWAKGSPMGSPL